MSSDYGRWVGRWDGLPTRLGEALLWPKRFGKKPGEMQPLRMSLVSWWLPEDQLSREERAPPGEQGGLLGVGEGVSLGAVTCFQLGGLFCLQASFLGMLMLRPMWGVMFTWQDGSLGLDFPVLRDCLQLACLMPFGLFSGYLAPWLFSILVFWHTVSLGNFVLLTHSRS